MAERFEFEELRQRLLRAGVAPRHVRRYVAELREHSDDLRREAIANGQSATVAEAEAKRRLGNTEELAMAMMQQRQFDSWCKRAPWAVFGLAPMAVLAVAYLVACALLLLGWNIFLPGAATPFGIHPHGPIYSVQNIYFQADKFLYFAAPVIVGWVLVLIAARQKIKSLWPVAGLLLLAVMGATNVVHASRTEVSGMLGHIRMDFTATSAIHGMQGAAVHLILILALTVLPYAAWCYRESRTQAA